MIPLLGFTPDLAPDTLGGICACSNIIPSDRGMKPAPSPVDAGIAALADDCRGIASVTLLDGTQRTIAGTSTHLYEVTAATWTDRRTAPNALGETGRWSFTMMGSAIIAASKENLLQTSVSGNFTSIAGAVKARYVTTASGFVVAGDINDGVDDHSDRWWCSGYQDYTDWTVSASTQCANGRLLDTAGGITGMRRLGDNVVAYKEKAIYVGIYVGGTVVWSFQKIPGEIGCQNSGLIVSNEQSHLFLSRDDFYSFDGTNLTPMNSPCFKWVNNRINKSAPYLAESTFDNERGIAWWFFPSAAATIADSWVCYHVTSRRWGYGTLDAEAVAQYINGGITYDTAPASWTYDSAPSYSYDSAFWSAITTNLAIIGSDHKLYLLNGSGADASMTLCEMGSDAGDTFISRVWPRYFTYPTTASMTLYAKYTQTASYSTVTTVDIYSGRFEVLSSALWHQIKIDMTGDWEIPSVDVIATTDGVV